MNITDQRTVTMIIVAVIVLVIAAIMIAFFQNRNKQRETRRARHEEFELKRDQLSNTILESELAKLRLAEKGRVLSEKFIEWKNRYEEAMEALKIDISNNIAMHEEYLEDNKLKLSDEIAPSVDSGLERVSSEFNSIEQEMNLYVDEDTKIRKRLDELQNEYAQVINAHNELQLPTSLNDEILSHFDEIDAAREQALIHIDESEYELGNAILKSMSINIKEAEKMITTYPKFLQILNDRIVKSLEELDKKYRVMKGEFFFEDLDLLSKQNEFATRFDDLIELLKNMNLKQLDVSASELSQELEDLLDFLNKEEVNRENVNKFVPELKKLVMDAQTRVSEIGEEWRLLQAYYDEDAFKGKSIVRLEERFSEVYTNFNAIEQHNRDNDASFSMQRAAIEVFVRDLNALNQHLEEFDVIIVQLRKDENDAKVELTHLKQLYRHTIRKVKQAHMPQTPAEYEESNRMSQHLLEALNVEIETLPVNVDRLRDTLEKCETEVVAFYEDSSKMVKTYNLSQRALVFANRYRHESPNIDSELTRAEFNFLRGFYGKSLEMTLGIIAVKDERMHEKLVNYYEENIVEAHSANEDEE